MEKIIEFHARFPVGFNLGLSLDLNLDLNLGLQLELDLGLIGVQDSDLDPLYSIASARKRRGRAVQHVAR